MGGMLLVLSLGAWATDRFDPSAPAERFDGDERYTIDGAYELWSAIERLEDPDRTLFEQEDFNAMTAWTAGNTYAPWIEECFGTGEPHSGTALLHLGVHEATATGTPILFVPGAGDNGSRGFVTMALDEDDRGRPVYALTFAHPHGDVFQQAEWVANAIARIKARTGATQVDVVAHSKGGLALAVYLSNAAGTDWADSAYESAGTVYRGDVRRAVFVAAPLGGVDTNFRWSDLNLASLTADSAMTPASWSVYYPYTTASAWVYTELSEQDFYAADGDLFPGQRQLLARQDYPLPGELAWLGGYAIQYDWYTTYEGGVGYYSTSEGIDAAIEAGGDLIARLHDAGADPEVELYLLAGENPLLTNGSELLLTEMFGEAWVDMATAGTDLWASLVADLVGDGLLSVGITEDEVEALAAGKLILGEITGPSDGLVFTTSALDEDALTARGAVVVEAKTANLSHLDLLYASEHNADLLAEAAAEDPSEDAWKGALAERYAEADTVGWLAEVLADPDTGGDGGGGSDGSGSDGGGSDGGGTDGGGTDGSGSDGGADSGGADTGTPTSGKTGRGCATGGGAAGWGWLVAFALIRSRRASSSRGPSPRRTPSS